MRYLYTIHGRNRPRRWGYTRRRQGRQVRYMLDIGGYWVGFYFAE